MGASESTRRKVSFGLDEEEKVTVIQGVKLSGDLLQRLRGGTGSVKPTPPQPASHKPDPGSGSGPTAAEAQEELRKKFELEQTRVQDQLARLAQREREAAEAMAVAAGAGRDAHDDLNPALLLERGKSHEELMKARQLPAELDARAKQLKKKEAELQHLAAFYKEQLQVLEKKNLDHYQHTTEQYKEAATKAEAHIKPVPATSVCPELQAQVLQCYRQNQEQTLQCSGLAKQYMDCIQAAKKNLLKNHG
uniref:Coiled-coil-helix-coiled-coil-helix domain containing 6b n=1 Tax=Esox lucius TaxID=8010 RepID=A0AAY5LBE9_ESOLU